MGQLSGTFLLSSAVLLSNLSHFLSVVGVHRCRNGGGGGGGGGGLQPPHNFVTVVITGSGAPP